MRLRFIVTLFLVVPVLASCTTRLQSQRVKDLSKPHSIAYYNLKQRKFDLVISRQLIDCVTAGDLRVSTTVKVMPAIVGDPDFRYEIPYERLSSGTKSSEFAIEYYPDRTIKSINVKIEDQTAKIIEKAIDVVSSVTVPSLSKFGKDKVACKKEVYDALKKLRTVPTVPTKIAALKKDLRVNETEIETLKRALSNTGANVEKILKEIKNLVSARIPLEESLKKKQGELASALSTLTLVNREEFLPEWEWNSGNKMWEFPGKDFDLPKERWDYWLTKTAIGALDTDTDSVNKFELTMRVQALLTFPRSPVYVEPPESQSGLVKGIMFRDAVDATLAVCQTACDSSGFASPKTRFEGVFTVPQAGPILMLTMTNRPFQKNTIKVAFSAEGRLEKLEYGDNARLAVLAESAAKTAGKIRDAVEAKKRADIEKAKLDKERLELERDIIKLREEIADLE